MSNIPASELVNVTSSVLAAAGNSLSLNGIMLTDDASVPIGVVQSFSTLEDVQNWFGPSSIQATLAAVYFSGFENAQALPSAVYFAQYNEADVGAYLRTGSLAAMTLTELQALSGTLVVVIDGRTVTSANIDLAPATSFTNAAALIQAGLQTADGLFSGDATIDDGAGGVGNTLTITAVTSGAVAIGDEIVGAGIAAGTTITAFGTGVGGIGTYTVSGAAQLVTPAEAVTVASAATCTYDSQRDRFLIHSATTGAASTIDYATGTLSALLYFTSATGATLSQGAVAATPATFMPTVVAQTQNWAAFMTTFEPDTATKLEFAAWVQTTNKRFAYVAWDSDVTPTSGAAPTSFGAQCVAAEDDGIFPVWEPADDNGNGRKAAFVCGTIASINYQQAGGRITFAFKGQAGLVADVTDATTADNLTANGYNFYAAYATAADRFVNLQHGSTPGAWVWFDSYVDQIWLANELQLALIELLVSINSLPYNTEGYNLIRQYCNDPIKAAKNAGVIRTGVTLSNAQRAQVNTAAGVNIADTLQNTGAYLQILDASPVTRAARQSPPVKLWYTDGGSIQKIDLAAILVQ